MPKDLWKRYYQETVIPGRHILLKKGVIVTYYDDEQREHLCLSDEYYRKFYSIVKSMEPCYSFDLIYGVKDVIAKLMEKPVAELDYREVEVLIGILHMEAIEINSLLKINFFKERDKRLKISKFPKVISSRSCDGVINKERSSSNG